MISPNEVIHTALSRNITDEHIREADIAVAEWNYVYKYIGEDLYKLVKANTKDEETGKGAYDDFIEDYVKPVLAYGVVFDIFERLTTEISDRGVVQMLSEGATIMDSDSRFRAKGEILNSLVVYLEKMIDFCDNTDSSDFDKYEDQEFEYGYQSPAYFNRNKL